MPSGQETVNPTTARERIVDAVGHAAHLAHEARRLKTLTSDAIEDGIHTAKRAVTRGAHEVEDLRDAAAIRVRKAPLLSVALAAGVGLLVGIAFGRWGRCAAQQKD